MKGRASLPGADELFRVTSVDKGRGGRGGRRAGSGAEAGSPQRTGQRTGGRAGAEPGTTEPAAERTPSGRQRHEEKVTFYCTADELMDLEHARLQLRRKFGIGVDRGRIVREALAQVLDELEQSGADSNLVKRLTR
jgi:hypothetical protein